MQISVCISGRTRGALRETSLQLLVQERMAAGTSATVWLPARLELVFCRLPGLLGDICSAVTHFAFFNKKPR